MGSFLTEVPRSFLFISGEDKNEVLGKAKEEMSGIIDEFAIVEDISDKPFPKPIDAVMSRNLSLLDKVVAIPETSRNITKATKGRPFLGPWGADIIMNNELAKRVLIETPEVQTAKGKNGCSLSAMLESMMVDVKTKSKSAAAIE